MSPPSHIPSTLLPLTTGPQVNTSTKPSESYSTTGQHVPTSQYISFSTTTYYRSTGQHVVKTPKIIPLLQVTMSPPHHISFSTTTYYRSTGQHVVKALKIILYYRSTCPHLAIYLIFYYYLLQVYRSTRRQTPQNHTITTGYHVPTSPYLILYYYLLQVHWSTCRQSPKNHTLLQVYMSSPRHISHSLLLPTTGLQVNTSSKSSESIHYYRSPCHHLAIYLKLFYYLLQVYRSTRCQNPQNHTNTTGHHVPTSPYILFSTTTYHRSTGQHVVKTLRSIPLPQVTMSPPCHISHSLLLPTTGLQVNTSSKLSEAYHYYRSPCPHLAIYLILYYYLLQVYRSTRRQNPQNHTITTGHHVTTSPYILFSLNYFLNYLIN